MPNTDTTNDNIAALYAFDSNRRAMLLGILYSASALTPLSFLDACSSAPQQLPQKPPFDPGPLLQSYPLVDVHSHIFNACDLPIEGFAREVLIGGDDKFYLSVPDFGVLEYITSLLREPAPTACAEAAEGGPQPALMDYGAYNAQRQAQTDQDRLANLLYWIYTLHSPADIPKQNSINFAVTLLERVMRSLVADKDHDPALDALYSLHSKSSIQDCRVAAKKMFDLSAGSSDVASRLSWLVKFSRSRKELLLELDSLFSAATATQAGTDAQYRIYVPAIVDYDYWLERDPDPNTQPGQCSAHPPKRATYKRSVVSEQVMAMSRISSIQPPNRAVLGFVPFDPLRQVVNELEGARVKALDVVIDAINNRGLVGVKLYPPMGFGAINNGALQDSVTWDNVGDYFGAQVLGRRARLRMRYPDISDFGYALDAALDELYTFCKDNDVPIMAHCSNSQQSFTDAGKRASPLVWRMLLENGGDNHEYRTLRLNLGHAGGPWCLGLLEMDELYNQAVSAGNSGDIKAMTKNYNSLRDNCETLRAKQWPSLVFEMASEQYPNVYFDIADWSEIYRSGWGTTGPDGSLSVLKSAFDANPEIGNRLMYGTDWSMLGQYAGQNQYCDAIYTNFANIFGTQVANNIMGRNALRFLGLVGSGGANVRNSAQRLRLRKFYGNTPKADELDHLFDTMSNAPAA